jgi:hypothetical protein
MICSQQPRSCTLRLLLLQKKQFRRLFPHHRPSMCTAVKDLRVKKVERKQTPNTRPWPSQPSPERKCEREPARHLQHVTRHTSHVTRHTSANRMSHITQRDIQSGGVVCKLLCNTAHGCEENTVLTQTCNTQMAVVIDIVI